MDKMELMFDLESNQKKKIKTKKVIMAIDFFDQTTHTKNENAESHRGTYANLATILQYKTKE